MPASSRLLIHPVRDVTIVNFNDSAILDALHVQELGDELYRLVDERAIRKLVLDFTKVQSLSSSALGMLITLRKKSSAIKGELLICGMRKDLQKVFQLTKLDRMFTFCANEEKALSHFGVTTAG